MKINKKNKTTKMDFWKTLSAFWLCFSIVVFLISIVMIASYQISWDKHYVNTVNERAFTSDDDKITDFKEGIVAMKDAEGKYEKKLWRLQNKEVYYYRSSLLAFALWILYGALPSCFMLMRYGWVKEFGDEW